MRDRCFICNKNLSKTLTILDAKYTLRNWNSYYDNKEYILYFSKNNMSTCVPCGKTNILNGFSPETNQPL